MILNSINTLCQVLLLTLAFVGYIYTAIPLYQNARLEEEKAVLESEIKENQVELEDTINTLTEQYSKLKYNVYFSLGQDIASCYKNDLLYGQSMDYSDEHISNSNKSHSLCTQNVIEPQYDENRVIDLLKY